MEAQIYYLQDFLPDAQISDFNAWHGLVTALPSPAAIFHVRCCHHPCPSPSAPQAVTLGEQGGSLCRVSTLAPATIAGAGCGAITSSRTNLYYLNPLEHVTHTSPPHLARLALLAF
uniref:Uncharacterized protein n=1 Tax=Ficedula albicollis TaxID=59894 RepID=A0A803V522_FICAL